MKKELICLTIDINNIIIKIDGPWDEAVKEGHGSKELEQNTLIGKSIEGYLGNNTVQMYYNAVFQLCRLKQETLVREYRCDSPTHQRYMQMSFIPLEGKQIKMVHETLKEIPFKSEVFIHDQQENKPLHFIKRCSICNSLCYPDSEYWIAPEDIEHTKPLHLKVIHTVCPTCQKKEWRPQ